MYYADYEPEYGWGKENYHDTWKEEHEAVRNSCGLIDMRYEAAKSEATRTWSSSDEEVEVSLLRCKALAPRMHRSRSSHQEHSKF